MGREKITRCLESLLKLKESDIEIIIVNDGSSDNTSRICERCIESDSRFQLINKKNGGVSSARNVGIGESTGKYIGFIDADDEITVEYNDIVKVIKNIDSDFYAFEHCIQTSNALEKRTRGLFEVGKNGVEILYHNFLSGIMNCVWNNIYKSSIIKDNQIMFPENMSMGEDGDFNAQYIQYCKNSYFIDRVGYKYYVDDTGSASNAIKLNYLKDFVKIYERYVEVKRIYAHNGYSFYCPYYIEKIYNILKQYGKQMTKIEKEEFRNSAFFHEIMKYKYKKMTHLMRKYFIRLYLLR